jgi:hypothetical protein
MIYNADSPEKTWTIKWGLYRRTPSLTAVDSVTGKHLAVLMMHEPLRNAFVVSKLARQAIEDAGYDPNQYGPIFDLKDGFLKVEKED